MRTKDLVPVQRAVTVPAAYARQAVARVVGSNALVSVEEDPRAPYRPGDPTVSMIVTTLEPDTAKPAVPWLRILQGCAAVLVAAAILTAVLIDVYLVFGAVVFAGFVVLALHGKPSDE